MFEYHNHTGKRVMAVLLVIAMMFAMLGSYAPKWSVAAAEEASETGDGSNSEASASESDESSSSDADSSGGDESSSMDSDTSEKAESSNIDDDTPDHGESSCIESDTSDEDESSPTKSGTPDEDESSPTKSGTSDEDESSPTKSGTSDEDESSPTKSGTPDEDESSPTKSGTSDEDESSNMKSETSDDCESISGDSPDSLDPSEASRSEDAASDSDDTEDNAIEMNCDATQENSSPDDCEAPDAVEGNTDVPETADGDAVEEARPSEESQSDEEDRPAEASGESNGADDPVETDDFAPVQAENACNPEGGDSGSAADVSTTSFAASLSPENTDAEEDGEPVDTQAAVPSEAQTVEAPAEMSVLEAPEMAFETAAYIAPAEVTVSVAPNAAASNSDPQISILQNMVDETLASVVGTLTGRLQVILTRNTTYEGDVTISAGDRSVADDFALELTAEDAGDDGMKGEGYTTIAGLLTIRGIKVVMNSVSMAAGQGINVINEGALQYNGTQNANNVLDVTVGKASSAEINTSNTNDSITVTAEDGAKSVSINAGDGMNTLNGTVNGGDFSFVSGNGSDTVNLDLEGSDLGAVYVDSGENIDDLTVTINAQAKDPATWDEEKDDDGNVISRKLVGGLYVTSGAGDDNVNVDVRANAGDITVDTALGSDAVYVFKGDHRTPESIDYTKVYNPYEEINENATSVVTFINGDPDAVDRLTVDVDASDAIGGNALQGGQGASVHLRGTLSKDDAPIRGDAARLTLTGENGNELFIATQQGEAAPSYNFTDALKNKRTVYLYGDGNGDYAYEDAKDDFTNYVFKTPVNALNSIAITGSDRPLLLSNVVLDAGETKDLVADEGDEYSKTEESIKVSNLSAANLNVLVKGRSIEIGNIAAQNVRAESVQGISTLYEALSEVTNSEFDLGSNTAFESTDIKQMVADLISLSDSASIVVRGNVTAVNDVALLARVKQYGDIFALMPTSLNIVNLKLASAGVNITETAALTARNGTVSAEAKIQTVTGEKISYDEDGVGTQSQSGPPLSVTWVTDDASVTVDKNARLQAAEDILLNSRTDIRVINNSRSGGYHSPVALAFTWISSTVDTAVHGMLEAGRIVSVTATGDISDDTTARRGEKAVGASGGFAAVNVVNQEVSAVIGEGAQVKAGGDVAVYTTNLVDAQTLAASSGPKSEGSGAAADAFLRLFRTVLEPIKEEVKLFFKDDYYTRKVEKLLKKIAVGDYRVNVVELSADNAEKGSASVSVKMRKDDEGGEQGEDHLWAIVNARPKAGCEVGKVQYRYLEAGDEQYTYKTVEKDEKGRYTFLIDHDDIEVIVTYSGEPSGGADPQPQPVEDDDFEDVFDIAQLFDDVADGVGDNADDDDEFQMDGDVTVHNSHPLSIDNPADGGKLVTWLTNDDDGNLDTIYGGQKVRFVPNPDAGMELDTLTVFYTEEGPEGYDVTRKVAVAADSQGRWYFTVPEDLANGAAITATATFRKAAGKKEAPAHNQAAGALAVGVVFNDGSAVIESGTVVEAGGTVDMIGTKRTAMNNQADGTAISEESGSASGEDKPQQTELTKYSIPSVDYALKADSTLPGALSGVLEQEEDENSIHPVITFKPDSNDWRSVKVAVSYYTKFNANPKRGSLWTSEVTLDKGDLDPNEDGSYSYQPELGDYAVVSGTTMEINLVFLDDDGCVMTSEGQGARQYLVRNPIRISNNALTQKDDEGKQQITEIGRVDYVRTEGSKYYVKLVPEEGYKVDALGQRVGDVYSSNKDALYASWRGEDGTLQRASLKHTETDAADEWFFDVSDGNIVLPEGALVTIGVAFVEDNRDIEVPEDVQEEIKDQGSVQFSKSAAKAGDEVTFTLTGKQGWYGSSVTVSWVEFNEDGDNERKSEALTPDAYGRATFTMPKMAESSTLQVTPGFSQRIVNLNVRGSTGAPDTSDKSLALSDTSGMGYSGEIITVSPSNDLIKDGYKVTDIKVQFNDDTQQIIPDTNDTFTISDIAESSGDLYISATLALKEIEVNPHTDAGGLGSIEPVSHRADKGDKVMVNIVPREGYRIRKGTLAAEIITKAGTRQIVLDYEGPNRYSFAMPGGDEIDATTVVNLTGEFEPGSDGVSLSLGVGVAVGVSMDKNDIEIKGGAVTAGTGISMLGISTNDKAVTEAKAGFNKGDTGLAGAFAVQVAAAETIEAIRKDDKGFITVMDGPISMSAVGGHAFRVTGDASGKAGAEASGTGVGAGIAFAVGSAATIGVIEDGVRLDRAATEAEEEAGTGAPASHITDIILSIGHKTRDQVTGKAGAIGGSAFVPVAAVDIFSSNVGARLGALDMSAPQAAAQAKTEADLTDADKLVLQNILPLTGMVKLKAASDSARVQYNHDIAADASARGGDTTLGGAFIVSWIGSNANARLNQSVSAPLDVSVNTSSGDALRAVATAAVSGGDRGKKDGKGGSADKQADKLMGGAGKVAAKYGGMDGAKLQNDAKGRQKAETAEGSVAGAGAFVLNIQNNESRAEITDGVDVITQGRLTVKSANRTEAFVRANASSTKSDTGVGVGVALNIVTMENIARIGNGGIIAGELELAAVIAKEPTMVRSATVAENASNFETQLNARFNETIKALIGEEDYEKLEVLIGPESTFFTTLLNKLVKDLNLSQLLNIAADDSGDSFVHLGEVICSRLTAFPEAVAKPLLTVLQEAGATVSNWDEARYRRFVDDLCASVTTQLAGNATEILKKTVMNSVNSLLGSSIDMVTDKISGKGWQGDKLKAQLESAMLEALREFTDAMIQDMVKSLNSEFPIVTENNVELVKKLKDATFKELRSEFLPWVTRSFREQVYDYEPLLVKIQQNGFADFLEDEFRALLKEAAVAATNEALEKLVGKLDVKFEREAVEDRHVITTQAISGAGAKTTTVAGSVSVAVANLTTTAELAGGEDAVNVTGDMIVNAEELRRIRTHATAAVDKRGEPDNNDGAGNTEKHETGGGSAGQTAVSQGNITVTTGVGGVASFDAGASEDNPVVWLDVDRGFNLPESGTFARSYTDKTGAEIVDTVAVHQEGDDFFIAPFENIDIQDVKAGDLKELAIGIDIEFDRAISGIKAPEVVVSGEAPAPQDGAVTVSAENGVVQGTMLKAEYGSEVRVAVDPAKTEGVRVQEIAYSYMTIEEGDIVSKTGTLSGGEVVKKSSNSGETVYVFSMPEYEVYNLTVTFEAGREERASESEATDGAGRSVGVGAAFALTYGNSDVASRIGVRGAGVTAGSLAVTASSEHEEENYSTAGTDPFAGVDQGEGNEGKGIGLDASLAINMLDNAIVAGIAEGTPVTTTAKGDGDGGEDIDVTPGALIVRASEGGGNETKASAFATGSSTAVGASVAVNVSVSDIQAKLGSGATASGKAVVRADSLSEDRTWSFASALGADVQRALNKVADGAKAAADTADSLSTGEYFDEKAGDEEAKKNATDTSRRIADRLNQNKAEGGDDASENLPVSANVLRSVGAVIANGEEANQAGQQAQDMVNEAGDQDIRAQENPNKKKKLQVAATVGVTVALHNAAVTVGGAIDAGGEVQLIAGNAGNFNTRSTAAAMTAEEGPGKTIAAAVGVSVNENRAAVNVKGDLKAGGDLTVASNLTQNMTDEYPGRLAVQALSGSVSGKGAEYAIAGAVGALVSHAASSATIENAGKIKGDAVKITATDKSKLAVRAGGVNVSRGANIGMGISVATIWSGDTVEAKIGDGATVDANSFEFAARKQAVTQDDYVFPLSWADLISDTSALNDDERQNVYAGLIDIHKKPGEVSYDVDVNMDTYALMKIPDMLNFLSATNYYTEAVAGSLILGEDGQKPNKLNGAGSISIVHAANTVNAALGNNVSIKKDSSWTFDALVESAAETNARILGGAVSGGPAQKSAGITLTFLYDEDAASTDIGSDVVIEGGKVALKSSADTAVQTFNAAASVNTSEQGQQTLGGAVNVLVLRNSAKTNAGAGLTANSGSSIDITAGANMDLKLVSAGISGARRGTAAGGTLAYIDDGADSEVNIGDHHSFNTVGKITISAVTKDRLISVLASASAATSAEGKAYAAAINVMNSSAKGNVTLGSDSIIKSRVANGIDILGIAGSTAVNITVAAAGSGGRAIGASVNANFYNRESTVNIGDGNADYDIEAANDILISAAGDDTTVMLGVAAAGSTDGMSIGGNLPIVSSKNTVSTKLARTTVNTTEGEAAIVSHLRDRTYAIAGSIALANGGSAAGATALMAFKKNTVTTDLGESSVTVAGSSGELASRVAGNPTFKGLYVGATDDNTVFVGAAGMALSSEKGITGNLVTLSSANTVLADASRAVLTAVQTPPPDPDMTNDEATGGDVTVVARNDNYQTLFAGGLNYGLSMGIGASLAVLVSNNDVRTKAHAIDSFGNVSVTAANDEHLLGLNVNAGGSGKTAVELGASILSIKSRVNAEVASAIAARNGGFDLKANNTTDLIDIAVALAGAGQVAASPVFVAAVFGGEANAKLNAGVVTAMNGVNVSADSAKNIDQYTVGASFAGETALSGAVSVVSVKDQTNALVAKGADITANALDVTASSDYKLTGASAAVSGGQIAGAVNGQVNIVKAGTLAEMEGKAALSGAANVKARSVRDIVNVEATVGAGQTGVGFAVMATVAGDRLDDDAVDMLTYGSSQSKDGGKAFDAAAMVQSLKDRGVDTSSLEEQRDGEGHVTQTSLADDLTGNGQRMSTTRIGDGEKFDAASGYVSGDLYDGGDGADAQFEETDDIKQARAVGGSAAGDPADAVNARIGGDAVVSANGVTVEAEQKTLADLYGATVGAGAATGVGISFSAAILRSNVFATSLGTIDAKEGEIVVHAFSHTGDITPEAGSDEEQRMKSIRESLGDALDISHRSIRTVGLAVGGAGTAAVAVTAGIVRLDNITKATMGGTVTNAGKLTVKGDTQYANVLAATLAAAGSGEIAVSGSIAGTGIHGTTEARLDGTANISGKTPNVNVTTNSSLKGNAVAAAVAASGGGAATAGLSAAVNELTQNTVVERGARIEGTGKDGIVTVKGNSDTAANAYLFTFDVGTVAIGLSAAYANVKPTQTTTVGVEGEGIARVEGIREMNVLNTAVSRANSNLLSASAGYGSILGSVMLAFNDTVSTAKVGSLGGQFDSLNINGQLKAEGNSKAALISGGAGALGVSVNYVDINSENTSELNLDEFTADVSNVSVGTNDDQNTYTTAANAESLAGSAAGVNVGVNTAIARNRARNNAAIRGKNDLKARVRMNMWGNGSASAKLSGLSIGGLNVMASVVTALNEASNTLTLKPEGALETDGLDIASDINGSTTATLETGSGSLVGIDVNVASAYGRTKSQIDVDIPKIQAKKIDAVNVSNTGADAVNTAIDNQSYSGINVATMVGVAHGQDVYDAKVKLGGEVNVGEINLNTKYNTNAQSAVTPSAAGIMIEGATLAVNLASATNTTDAATELALADTRVKADGKVNVYTRGNAGATGWIKPALFQWDSTVGVGVNRAKADLAATQSAALRMDDSAVDAGSDVNVKSVAEKADALATISTSGSGEEGKDRLHLSLVSVDVNTAIANERMNSSASVIGSGAGGNSLKSKNMYVFSGSAQDAQTTSTARTDGGEDVTFISVGNLDGSAVSSENFNVTAQGFSADIDGEANLLARTNVQSMGVGYAPGNFALFSKSSSNIDAGVGAEDQKQTAKVTVGEDINLAAEKVVVQALNTGYAEAAMKRSSEKAMIRVDDATQPTHSWYDTAVVIGDGARLTSGAVMDLLSQTDANAKSNFESSGMSLLVNAGSMKGENNVNDANRLTIGKGAALHSGSDMSIRVDSTAKSDARTTFNASFGVYGGETVYATNNVTRALNLLVDEGASIRSDGSMMISSIVGKGDAMETHANQEVYVGIDTCEAHAELSARTDNTIDIRGGVNIAASGDVVIKAQSSGVNPDGYNGYYTRGYVNSDEGYDFVDAPDAYSKSYLGFNTAINLNADSGDRTYITSDNGSILVLANNEGLHSETKAEVLGDGFAGAIKAETYVKAELINKIKVNKTTFSGKTGTSLRVNFGENYITFIHTWTRSRLYSSTSGIEKAYSTLEGKSTSNIFTDDRGSVEGGDNFIHEVRNVLHHGYDFVTDGSIIVIDWEDGTDSMQVTHHCDLCASSGNGGSRRDANSDGSASASDFVKTLVPLNDIRKRAGELNYVAKAFDDEYDILAAEDIFILSIETPLKRDMTLDGESIDKYRLWKNIHSGLEVYLLPNATRLYALPGHRLQYVADVLHGDVLGNGEHHNVDIITALTGSAFSNPVIPIGRAGKLDFSTGAFTLPENADFELYLREVSGAWLIEKLADGFIRRLDADQAEIAACVTDGANLPQGVIVEGLTEDGVIVTGSEGTGDLATWKLFWLGDTPETAEDPDQALIFLLLKEKTDELDAFRTSVNKIASGEAPVDVSLYLFRDSESDSMGEEKYNCMFFDTPEGEKSRVRVVTNVLVDGTLENPMPATIALRGFTLDGADAQAFAVNDHCFVMCDGTDGEVNIFGGAYQVTFDGDCFESDYMRIEGIKDGNLKLTLKQGQNIWMEWN